MKTIISILFFCLLFSCEKKNIETKNITQISPTGITGNISAPQIIYILHSTNKPKGILDEFSVNLLRIYFFEGGQKKYFEGDEVPYYGGDGETLRNPFPKPPKSYANYRSFRWKYLYLFENGILVEDSNGKFIIDRKLYNGYIFDNGVVQFGNYKGVSDFFLEFEGKTIGQLIIKSEWYEHEVLKGQKGLKITELKWNNEGYDFNGEPVLLKLPPFFKL